MKLNARELRELEEKRARGAIHAIKRCPIYFILENIYDTYNIGGLFRLADAIAAEKIFLCGNIEIPPNSRIKKASIGTYKIVPWEYKKTAAEVMLSLRAKRNNPQMVKQIASSSSTPRNDIRIFAVEQHSSAIVYTKAQYQLPLALVFGNETSGVTPETLKLVDQIIEIPMWGVNKSLNVIVSAAIVSYWTMSKHGKM